MFIIDELDSVYDGFCSSDHKITYIIMGMLFPIAIVFRFFVIGVCYVIFRGKRNVVLLKEDDIWVVKNWYYGRQVFGTEDEALRFCEHNNLKAKKK